MAPIHETDVAEERWSKAQWENYELWEKVELRLKRQKYLWILATTLVFLILSAVPIMMDRWPKWKTRSITRHLAQTINQIKREASVNHAAYRIRFIEDKKFEYVIERSEGCDVPQGQVIRSGALVEDAVKDDYVWISSEKGTELGIPGLVNAFCYDPLEGSGIAKKGEAVAGFAVIPVKDLTEKRLDRISILLLTGSLAEISFE